MPKGDIQAVSAAILVLTLLKIIIVISTTLFLPSEDIICQREQLSLESRFDSASFWISTSEDLLGGPSASYPDTSTLVSYSNISADPVWAYINLRKEYTSDPPVGLSTALTHFSVLSEVPIEWNKTKLTWICV